MKKNVLFFIVLAVVVVVSLYLANTKFNFDLSSDAFKPTDPSVQRCNPRSSVTQCPDDHYCYKVTMSRGVCVRKNNNTNRELPLPDLKQKKTPSPKFKVPPPIY